MNNSENNENETLKLILIGPMVNFLTIGFIALFTIAYGEYAFGKWPLWVFILVSLLNILWNIFYPLSCYISLIKNKDIIKKIYLWYLIIIVLINLICVMIVNSTLGYVPKYMPFLFGLLLIIIILFMRVFFTNGQERKKEVKHLIIVILFLGFIVTLFYVCVEDFPLWTVNLVLVITILYFVFCILLNPKADKDGKRLLLWGGLGGILFIGIMLVCVFLNIKIPAYLKCLAFPIGAILGSIIPADKKF